MTAPNHEQVRLLLAHYRELDDRERRQVEQHLATCADCRAIRATYEQQNASLRALPNRTPSSQIYRNLTAEIAHQPPTRPWYRRLPAEVAFVAIAATLLLAFFSVIQLQGLPQETAAHTATPDALVVGVDGTVEPVMTPTRTVPPPAAVAATVAVTSSAAVSATGAAEVLPSMTYVIDRNDGTTLVAARLDGAEVSHEQTIMPALEAAPRVSPDGRWTALGRDGITLLPNTGDPAVTLVPADELPGEVVSLAWAPEGAALAATVRRPDGTYQVSTIRLQAGLPQETFGFDRGFPRLLGWDATGQQVVILLTADETNDASGQIQILAPGQAPVIQPYSYAAAPGWRLHQATLGPRGRWVYYLADQPGGGSVLIRQSLRDGSQTVALSATLPIDSYILADDENHVVYTLTAAAASGAPRTNVRLLTFSTGKPVALTNLAGSPVSLLAWSPMITSPLESWVVLSWPTTAGAGQELALLRPADGITLPVKLEGLADTATTGLRLAGWSSAALPVDDVDATNFDQAVRAIGQALTRQQWPVLTRWLTDGQFTRCQYQGTCTRTTSTADALWTLIAAFRDADVRIEPDRQVIEPPGFAAPGEAAVVVRRAPTVADVDSSHLYLQRSEDGRWHLSGVLTGIPYYDAPSLAEVRAAPSAFAGLEVAIEGEYFVTDLPADLPADAPHLGQWVLRDASGASLWVRNATPDVGQGIEQGNRVQVLGLLKVEQGWPFLEVSLVRPLAASSGS